MKTKEDVIEKILEMWEHYPDWRLGQMLCNIASWERGLGTSEIWELTNEEIINGVAKHLEKKSRK